MEKSMRLKRRMTLWCSRSIKICSPKKNNATRPLETKKASFLMNISKWGMVFLLSIRLSTTRLGKNSNKTKLGSMTTKAKAILTIIWNLSLRREASIPPNQWILLTWQWRSRLTWWKKWNKELSPGPRLSNKDSKSSKTSWKCWKSNTRRSRSRKTRNNWAKLNSRSAFFRVDLVDFSRWRSKSSRPWTKSSIQIRGWLFLRPKRNDPEL